MKIPNIFKSKRGINGNKGKPPMIIEKRNAYICPKCKRVTLTVHIHEGTTPAYLKCKYPGCDGTAVSFFYRVPPVLVFDPEFKPSHEWYRPGRIETNMLSRKSRDQVEKGTLLLRERTDAEPLKITVPIV